MFPSKPSVRLEGVLFDLYGTTIDIEVDEDSPRLWHGLAAAFGDRGVVVEPLEVRRRFRTFLRDEAQRGREGFLMEAVFRRLSLSFGAEQDLERIGKLFRELSLKQVCLRSYVQPLFERLRRSGVRLGIVSNTEAVLTRFELDRFAILQTAHTIVLSSDVGLQKPNPGIFRLALDHIGGAPPTTVFVGNDWTVDVLGARNVGLRAIYVNDRAAEDVVMSPGMPGIIEVAPTLAAITSALRMCGWQETDS